MRYQFIGKTRLDAGKTLWEIVGNLKNFGVGRIVQQSIFDRYPEPSFLKIVKIVPYAPPRHQFEDRRVILYAEEVFRGRKLEDLQKKLRCTDRPYFRLVPKSEEEALIKAHEEIDKLPNEVKIPKYIQCPPLFKELWEAQQQRQDQVHQPIPPIPASINYSSAVKKKIILEEKTFPTNTTHLYRTDVPVEQLIKEIVRLRKLVKANSPE